MTSLAGLIPIPPILLETSNAGNKPMPYHQNPQGPAFPYPAIVDRTQGLRTFLTPRTSALAYGLRHEEMGYGTEKLPAIAPCR